MDFGKKKLIVMGLNVVIALASLAVGSMWQDIQVQEALAEILKVKR